MSRVLTVGTFDLWHKGHINLVRSCYYIAGANDGQNQKHCVIVGLNTDEFVEEFKGKRPIQSYAERYAPIATCKYVWETQKNEAGVDLKPIIEKTKPNFLVVGSDWAKKDYYAQTQLTKEWLNSKNVVLLYLEYTEGISTTKLKERIIRES